jgi:3-methyladenine DNA glycosylase/8-oxoguanine DNA glycosylase
MEHIVQFGINIDDTSIRKAIENNVMNQVANQIRQDVIKNLTGKKDYTNYEYNEKMKQLIAATTENFLQANREDIIEETAKKLAEKLSKTKAVKEMINNTLNSLLE